MNAVIHSHHAGSQHEAVERALRSLRSAPPGVIAVLIFLALFVAALAVRFASLARTNPEAAATLHRIALALGLGS